MKGIFKKFPEYEMNALAPSFDPSVFVGNVVPKNFLISPIGEDMSVYFRISCYELIKKRGFFGTQECWEETFSESNSVSFFLSHPDVPSTILSIPVADASIEFQSYTSNELHIGGGLIKYAEDISNNRIFSNNKALLYKNNTFVSSMLKLPVELAKMANRHNFAIESMKGLYKRLKFVETVIGVGSEICVIGILMDVNNDPSILLPVDNSSVDQEYFTRNNWSSQDAKQWTENVKLPVYLCSDNTKDRSATIRLKLPSSLFA